MERLCENAMVRHGENEIRNAFTKFTKHCENDALKPCENAPMTKTTELPKLGENVERPHGENASKVDFTCEFKEIHSHEEILVVNETLKVDENEHKCNAYSKGKKCSRQDGVGLEKQRMLDDPATLLGKLENVRKDIVTSNDRKK